MMLIFGCSTKDATKALIRGDKYKKQIALVFTGHEFADGREVIPAVLKKHNIKASFFFTGDFYRTADFEELIVRLKSDGHYLGAHSDKHLLYNDWTPEKNLLVTEAEFKADLINNYREMQRFGIAKASARFYLPPYEWNDSQITQWTAVEGLILINYTPGTLSHADYTVPQEDNYKSSDEIYKSILNYEGENDLNGFILLSHIGTDPARTDKFYLKLDALIQELQARGYSFTSLNKLY